MVISIKDWKNLITLGRAIDKEQYPRSNASKKRCCFTDTLGNTILFETASELYETNALRSTIKNYSTIASRSIKLKFKLCSLQYIFSYLFYHFLPNLKNIL